MVQFKRFQHGTCLIVVLSYASWGLINPTFAATTAEDLFSLSLEELAHVKIRGSTLTDESILTVPAAVSVFTRRDIQRLGVNRLAQLANFVPGFQAYRTDESGLQEAVSNRGRRLGTAGREILVLLDGVRLNNDNVGGAFAHYPFITLSNVERVEFIRGPGSAIHGANAALAVINIITLNRGRTVQASVGEHGGYQATVQGDLQRGSGQLSLMAESLESQGEHPTVYDFVDGRWEDTNDPYGVQTLHMKGSWSNWSGALHYNHARTPDFYVLGGATIEENETYIESYSGDIKHRTHITDAITQDTLLYYKRHVTDAKGIIIKADSPLLAPNTAAFVIGGETLQQESGVNWTLSSAQSEIWHWLVGAEYRRPEILDSSLYGNYSAVDLANFRFPPPLGYGPQLTYYGDVRANAQSLPHDYRTIRSAYSQVQLYPFENWDFVVGGRVDNFSDFGSHFSPRLASIYHVDDNNAVKLTYGEAFRPPGTLELYTQNSVSFEGNPDLIPEVTKTTEFTWEHIQGNSQWSTTIYNVLIDDAFVRVIPVGSFKRKWINGERLTTSGLELEGRYALNDQWSLRATGSTVFDEILDINSESEQLASLTVQYDTAPWIASLSSVYHGPRRDANTSPLGFTAMGGHTLWNGRVAYAAIPTVEVFVRAENLLNKDYVVPAEQALSNIVGVPGHGRYVEIGLNWDYE